MKKWKNEWKGSVKLVAFVLLLSFILTFFVEFLARGNIKEVWVWGKENNAAWAANYLIVLGLLLLLTAIIGRTRTSFWVLSMLLLLPSAVSGVRWKTEGVPLFPWDVALGYRNFHLSSDYPQYFTGEWILGIGIFVGLTLILLHWSSWFRFRLNLLPRIVATVCAFVLLAIPYADKPYPLKKNYNLSTIPWNQEQGYNRDGFLLSSMMNLGLLQIQKPQGYGAKRIQGILNGIEKSTSTSTIHPNMIVILSEAFWDPTIMKDVKFSVDPIPTYHKLAQQFPSGWMLSPQFGGGTANVEFEVLTGNSMRFLPDGSIPYVNYIHQGIDSLASILSRQGYCATAVNPLDSWFFHSKNVYQDFGFSRFISSEYFPQNTEGMFLADREVANQIIQITSQSVGPDFIFANTMENHYPFYPGKFKENTIKVDGKLTEASKGELETYAQGISNADKMLEQLVNYYSHKKEPTMVVFFGDHLPALDDSVYKEANYFTNNDPDLLQKKYRVPVLVWNNFLPDKKESIYISPSFLGPYALHEAGLRGTEYYDFLYSLSKRIPVIPPASSYDKMHIHASEFDDYKQLEYDALFGEQYAYRNLSQPIVQKKYALGPADIVVDQAVRDIRTNDKESLLVSGKNFPPDCVLFVNGKPMPTKVENTDHLSASIPKEEFKDGAPVNLQVKILDSRHIVVSRSNTVKVDLKE
jgi:phosphoglycerol transferase MdoB-like AlkP superfamily enzyme